MELEYYQQTCRRMKSNLIRFHRTHAGGKTQEISHVVETPADQELHRLRGLSAEVGAACTAWLANRGIKTRPWGQYPTNNLSTKRSRLEFAVEGEE